MSAVGGLLDFLGGAAPRANPAAQELRRRSVAGGPSGSVEVTVVSFDDSSSGPRVVELSMPGDRVSFARAWVGTAEQVARQLEAEHRARRAASAVRASPPRRVGWLEWVGVHGPRREQGYGGALLRVALAEVDRLGAEATWLKLGGHNATPREVARLAAWYGRHGFAFGPDVDEGVMVRAAPPPASPEDAMARLAEERGWPDPRSLVLYHGTLRANLPGIRERGLEPAVGPLTRSTFGDLGPLEPLVFASPSLAVARQAIAAQVAIARGRDRGAVTDAHVRMLGAVVIVPRAGFVAGYSAGPRPPHSEEADWYAPHIVRPLARVWGDDLDLLFALHGLNPLVRSRRGWGPRVARWLASGG